MLKRMKAVLAGALAIGFQMFAAGSASAHHLSVSATAVCSNGSAVIQYTATSWLAGLGGGNPQVQIQVNSVPVATGAFQSPSYAFSGTTPAPSGTEATVTALALGSWDDGSPGGASASVVVSIPTDCVVPGTGRFTGGGKQVRVGDVFVTRGFTIHCDLLLSNNLEVNWGGNKFHMTEHLTTITCSDDPAIAQAPPAAPIDTLVGVGTGRYNGVDGYTIRFTLVDAGEPGTADRMGIQIFQTSNPANVVLNVPVQTLAGGNLQAHYDQPHK